MQSTRQQIPNRVRAELSRARSSPSVRLVGWGAACIALLLANGCEAGQASETLSPPSPKAMHVTRGTRVVVERTAGEFIEATVLEEQAEHLKLQTADGARSLRVSRTDIYPVGQGTGPTPVGSYAICGVKRLEWVGCRVLKVGASQSLTLTPDSKRHELASSRVLGATPLTRMNIEHLFVRSERQRQFMRDLQQAGRPQAPAGWRPSPRERVVARRGDDWYTARVHELEDDGVRVRWRGQANIEKVGNRDLVPEPPYRSGLQRGDFAMVRPRADSEPWTYVRVRAVTDDFKVEDVKGQVTHVNKTALVPISRD